MVIFGFYFFITIDLSFLLLNRAFFGVVSFLGIFSEEKSELRDIAFGVWIYLFIIELYYEFKI
jgi:hypothetical protein